MTRCSGDVKQAVVDVHRLNEQKKDTKSTGIAGPILTPHLFVSFWETKEESEIHRPSGQRFQRNRRKVDPERPAESSPKGGSGADPHTPITPSYVGKIRR